MSNLIENPTLVEIKSEKELIEGETYLVWGGTGEISAMMASHYRGEYGGATHTNALYSILHNNGELVSETPIRFNEVMKVFKIIEREPETVYVVMQEAMCDIDPKPVAVFSGKDADNTASNFINATKENYLYHFEVMTAILDPPIEWLNK